MTDGRFPERWLNDRRFARISDAAFKLFVVGNTWSASNRTDGAITHDDLFLFPRHVGIDRVHELVAADLWIEADDGWQITGYAHTQTTAAQLEAMDHARMLDRERKARARSRERVSPGDEPVRPDIPADVPVENTGQDRTGQDRKSSTPAFNEEMSDSEGRSNFGRGGESDMPPAPAPAGAEASWCAEHLLPDCEVCHGREPYPVPRANLRALS